MPATDRVQRATFALQMAEFSRNVGRRMLALRNAKKAEDPRWTQDYVARLIRTDLTGAQYARWERGEVLPRKETLERIAEVFGVQEAELYAGRPLPPAEEGPREPNPDALADLHDQVAQLAAVVSNLDQKLDEVLARESRRPDVRHNTT